MTLISNAQQADLLKEIEKMAQYIFNAKIEIAAIAPEPDQEPQHINNAEMELNEVVKATEEATNRIMDEADLVQAIADKLDDSAAKDQLTIHVANLMEACAFQDITGQRITKVLRVLEHIESRVGKLVKIFGGALPEGYTIKLATAAQGSRPDESLMNGPQLGKDAPSQDDIDKLFASL